MAQVCIPENRTRQKLQADDKLARVKQRQNKVNNAGNKIYFVSVFF
jgi:hypothetical protein